METKLMEILHHENGWKGTWYRTGERHFVRQDERWPAVVMQRWRALDVCGGINERDCREVRGPLAWLKCALRSLRPNNQVRRRTDTETMMLPEQMATDARGAIAAGTNMSLTLPRGATRKLPGFPRGELLCECHDGRNVYSYDPRKVLAWLTKNALIPEDADAPSNKSSAP